MTYLLGKCTLKTVARIQRIADLDVTRNFHISVCFELKNCLESQREQPETLRWQGGTKLKCFGEDFNNNTGYLGWI